MTFRELVAQVPESEWDKDVNVVIPVKKGSIVKDLSDVRTPTGIDTIFLNVDSLSKVQEDLVNANK